MELSGISFGGTKVPWNSMEYSMEFHGTKLYFIWRYQSSMEFLGIFHGFPWNTCVIWNGALIPWNAKELGDFFYLAAPEFYGIPWNIPCKSRVPWNLIKCQSKSSMELNDISFGGTRFLWNSMESSMEFHGALVPFEMAPSLFHGIPWNSWFYYLATPAFHGTPWNIPWKSRVTWYSIQWQSQGSMEFHGTSDVSFGGIRVPWNSMEYSMEFHGTPVSFEMAPI